MAKFSAEEEEEDDDDDDDVRLLLLLDDEEPFLLSCAFRRLLSFSFSAAASLTLKHLKHVQVLRWAPSSLVRRRQAMSLCITSSTVSEQKKEKN